MTLTRPIKTRRFTSYFGESLRFELALAVWLQDEFTGQAPPAGFRLFLKEQRKRKPFRNPGGYYCFTRHRLAENPVRYDLPDGQYRLVLEPDPVTQDWYFLRPRGGQDWSQELEREVTIQQRPKDPLPDDYEYPVEQFDLVPKSSYPFPVNTTLLRGRAYKVVEGRRQGIASAVVRARYIPVAEEEEDTPEHKELVTTTGQTGEFVFFFKDNSDLEPGCTVMVDDSVGDPIQKDLKEGTTVKGFDFEFAT